jgi:hypothetical protein
MKQIKREWVGTFGKVLELFRKIISNSFPIDFVVLYALL